MCGKCSEQCLAHASTGCVAILLLLKCLGSKHKQVVQLISWLGSVPTATLISYLTWRDQLTLQLVSLE